MIQEQLAFFEKYPAGIYQKVFLCTLEGEQLHVEDQERFETDLERFSSNPERGYIKTPQQFFERWLNGRRGEEPKLNQYHPKPGFELQMPTVRTERFDNGTIFGRIEGLVLASDFGYTSDFRDRLVFFHQ